MQPDQDVTSLPPSTRGHIKPKMLLILAVYIVTFVFGFPANSLALLTFIKKMRQKMTPMDVLLLNLIISDLLFLLFLPFRMKEAVDNMEWNMPYFLCPLSGYIFYTTIYNSVLFMTGIAVERYLGVAFPIKYRLKIRPLYAAIYGLLVWTLTLSHGSILYIMEYFNHENTTVIDPSERKTCYKEFTKTQLEILLPVRLEVCIVLFLVPLLICFFSYLNFTCILSRKPNISLGKRNRAISLVLGTMLVFLICFVPYNLTHIIGFVNRRSPSWRKIAVLTSTLNTCLDPIIFYFSSLAFQNMLKSIIRQMGNWLYCCVRKATC